MNPSTSRRLASMITAMTQSIIPAIDPADALAREQAGLVLGHLHMLQVQSGNIERFEQLELRATVALGNTLLGHAAELPHPSVAASGLRFALDRASGPSGTGAPCAEDMIEMVNAAIEDLVEAGAGEDGVAFMAKCQASIVAHGHAMSLRNRSWFAATCFEFADAQLPEIPEMLDAFEAAVGI